MFVCFEIKCRLIPWRRRGTIRWVSFTTSDTLPRWRVWVCGMSHSWPPLRQMSLFYLRWSRGGGRRHTHSTCQSERLRCLSRMSVVSGDCLLLDGLWRVWSMGTSQRTLKNCWDPTWWRKGPSRDRRFHRRMTSVSLICGRHSGKLHFSISKYFIVMLHTLY